MSSINKALLHGSSVLTNIYNELLGSKKLKPIPGIISSIVVIYYYTLNY